MQVRKRNGQQEAISFDKVLRRISVLCDGLPGADATGIAQRVITRIYDGVKTSELDELAAQTAASLTTTHPDYGILAARIIISNHHKNTSPSFSETMALLYQATDTHGQPNPLISDELWDIVQQHKEKLNSVIDYARDFDIDYFGFKTLERSYLMKVDGRIVERPQHLWMRVALGIHGADLKDAIETYEMMSGRRATHATPTLFNAGTRSPQLASCFLLGVGDSVSGMYESLGDCAQISKHAGGIGIHLSSIRARGSHIRGTNGTSSGIIPFMRVYNATARHINQGSKRLGSIAIYLEPWHSDVEDFLEVRKNHGNEEERCRDLFTALWIPDLFMKRVEAKGDWSLMCPDECPGLADVYGDEFDALYTRYEAEGRYRKRVKAQALWLAILKSQIETGTPYVLYKDAVNAKSNQKNVGVIKSSNLCTEICEVSTPGDYATCNLASISLAAFVREGVAPTTTGVAPATTGVAPTTTGVAPATTGVAYDFAGLHAVAGILTKNINKIIDRTFYPTNKTRRSNQLHRPLGIGVQGLADVYARMRVPFDSEAAAALNREIFETIYHGALTASMEIARKRAGWIADGNWAALGPLIPEEQARIDAGAAWPGAYATFEGSPASKGLLQQDLWEATGSLRHPTTDRWDWATLRADIAKWGLRNSLLLAPMPTASTSQILGNTECFEPITSNIYQRRTLAGEYTIINKYLLRDLIELGIWNTELKNKIIAADGSVQGIAEIPAEIRELYKTAWELRQKVLVDQAADRGVFICQSQSLNLFVEDPDYGKLTNMHFYAWKRGLKTGMYYLRTRPKAKAQAFTLDPSLVSNAAAAAAPAAEPQESMAEEAFVCRRDDPTCMMCSS